jgi:hypothetical protein
MKRKFFFFLLVFILLIGGCGGKNAAVPQEPEDEPAVIVLPEPEPTEICRFCSTEIPEGTSLNRPFLVIYDNVKAARPPSGLEQACLVYELPVEGGVTRLLAFFGHDFPGNIGPIRSARPYMAVLTLEHGGILAHCGFSPRGQEVLRQLKVAHINEISYSQFYFRNKQRNAPHNLYSSMELLHKGSDALKFETAEKVPAVFRTGTVKTVYTGGKAASSVKITFSNAVSVNYVFNSSDGHYLRSMNGQPHVEDGGKNLTAKNLVVQFVRIAAEEPNSERLDITLTGQGEGYYFSGGKAYPLSWSKKDAASPTRYTVDGKELVFEPGTTWIHLVSTRHSSGIVYE